MPSSRRRVERGEGGGNQTSPDHPVPKRLRPWPDKLAVLIAFEIHIVLVSLYAITAKFSSQKVALHSLLSLPHLSPRKQARATCTY